MRPLLGMVAMSLALVTLAGRAQEVPGNRIRIAGMPLGSGVPLAGPAPAGRYADPVAGGDYHVPNYLPGHPTAATLWPREVRVPCRHDEASGDLVCAGYDVSPLRGEYIYVRPVWAAPAPPAPAAPPVHKKPLG